MFTTEFHEKQLLATGGDPPIRIEEWPEWQELQHLKDKILYRTEVGTATLIRGEQTVYLPKVSMLKKTSQS